MAKVRRIVLGRNVSFALNNKDVFIKPKVEFDIEVGDDETPEEAIELVSDMYEKCMIKETLNCVDHALDCIGNGSVEQLVECLTTRLDELEE